ncbi:MAG: DEAD/DEAH box helicase, partial [Gammaproteobacteria bacterium]
MLREYQQRAIDMLYAWFEAGGQGNPCLVLPTGSGKSHIVAALCKDALQNWPETRVLMLTHVKELIEQNAEKMRLHWPNAPMGIYSASIGKKQLGEPITFAGIQSVRNKAKELGHIDLVIIDECHLVNHRDEGGYRQL